MSPLDLGREILDALIAKGTHELSVLTRSVSSSGRQKHFVSLHAFTANLLHQATAYPDLEKQGVRVVKVDYNDKDGLTTTLQGVEVVLSFVVAQSDPEGTAQKNLIDASVAAGVKRFAPSEWAS